MFNVTRPLEVPESLLSQSKYDGEDVYKILSDIFFKKCYICETKEPHDIHVEHFHAHQGDVKKKYEWNNLYLACSRCNNIKSSIYNNMLDCCDGSNRVFRAIKHVPPLTPFAKSLTLYPMNDDERTLSTHQLLDRVYNSDHTINKKVSSAFLRKKIFIQYNLLFDQMVAYFADIALDSEKAIAIERIKKLIDKSAPYSAFIRWSVLDDAELGPLLEGFMD